MTAAVRSDSQAGPTFYAGLFLTTLSTLMYEVLLTRIFSVTMWFHFAFVAVSVALFGMTVGALIVHLFPGWFPQERVRERVFQVTVGFSLAIVFSFLTQLAIPFDPRWSFVAIYSMALTYFVIAIPFIFSGIAVCLALTRFPRNIGRLYAADLLGAGLGTILLIVLLNLLEDGPSAVLAVAAIAAVAAVLFAWGVVSRTAMLWAGACAAVLVAFALGNAVSAQQQDAFLRIYWAKGRAEENTVFEKWNPYSRIKVSGNPNVNATPWGWGLSRAMPRDLREQRYVLNIDASAATALIRSEPDAPLEQLRYDIVQFVHYVRPDSHVFIVGSGGGRDVQSALLFDQPAITAVELNKDILETVNGRYGDFTGNLDQQPSVHFVNDEARSYLARTDDEYDIVQFSLIDTWAATAAGAFALSENALYTTDAWEEFYDHLSAKGVLTVSRWYVEGKPLEAYRLTALAAETLRQQGVENPRDHIILIKSPPVRLGVGVANIMVSKEPFTPQDVQTAQQNAERLQFDVLLAPGYPQSDPTFVAIADAENPNDIDIGVAADLSAPSDDRPFFFQMVGFTDIFDQDLYDYAPKYLIQPVLVLASLSITVLVMTALFIMLPLLLTTSRTAIRSTMPFVVFFASIGLGFLLIEIAQMQRLNLFLGHPTYALSVVLFSLLIFSGLGSLLSDRIAPTDADGRASVRTLWPIGALLVVVAIAAFLTPALIDQFRGEVTPARIAISVLILAPMGLAMGMPFPIGMKLASRDPEAPTAFFWGINGATSVCASVLAVAISLGWGISMAFWAGFLAYAVAAAALAFTVRRPGATA